ncbi:MAG: glycosyltransferase family 4 protein [Candidatus Falkowbacteria bacterium]|nr:MAG: glycosyltransferase family 4 protein [Candidatus Falkowbacteria bacterium]
MKIAINALPYVRWSGIETFLHGLLASWPLRPDDEVVIFANQISAEFFRDLPPAIKIRIKEFKKPSRLNLFLYQQFGLPKILRREGFNLLFCASLIAPLFYRQKIITIHDAAPFVLKAENSLAGKLFWRLNLFFGKLTSLKIMTVSEFSRQELIKHLDIRSEKLEIIYNGSPVWNPNEITFSKLSFQNQPYIIALGNARPRKNLPILIGAFNKLAEDFPDLRLIIIGKKDERMDEIAAAYGNNGKLLFTGFISESDKINAIKGAGALIFPSLYEGFGLPIVEANILETPVICSDIPAFREVAADAALFFDPKNEDDIILKIKTLLNSQTLAADLKTKGRTNAQRFSWEASALKLSEIIHRYETPANK